MCSSGEVEDIDHLIMSCEVHAKHRTKMLKHVPLDSPSPAQRRWISYLENALVCPKQTL
jgi:hypothetical protein